MTHLTMMYRDLALGLGLYFGDIVIVWLRFRPSASDTSPLPLAKKQ
jgi:hypothetical protein